MTDIKKLQKEFSNELTDNILNYWVKKVYDPQRNSFTGTIGHDEKPDRDASLGVVLVSRILWTFSSAYTLYPTAVYRKMADEAYRILSEHFTDKKYGGVYWEVNQKGIPLNSTKQSYGEAFALYAFSEYGRVFGNQRALAQAVDLFHLLDNKLFDRTNGGYFEAATTDWAQRTPDFITPPGDKMNKSMNTHLHLLEAFTNLYRAFPDSGLKEKIIHILGIFEKFIIRPSDSHFDMFFDDDWSVQSTSVSFGHDIEGSWLLWESAETLRDHSITGKIKPVLIKMACATGTEATDKKGGLYNENDKGHWDKDFHWWPQAEAVVGFFNAYQLTRDKKFLEWSCNAWKFIQKYQVDHLNGEWFWLVTPEYKVKPMVKVSAWKCPYHNGRMCMEMIRRLDLEDR